MTNKTEFFEKFDSVYANRLNIRMESFRLIFSMLESQNKESYLLVETGCMRQFDNMECDGMSTFLFDHFVRAYGGSVISIDFSKENINEAAQYVSDKVTFFNCDSVFALYHLWRIKSLPSPDFVYLDSFDLDIKDHVPSAKHHLKELVALAPYLKSGAIICVDDNPIINGEPIGKGMFVREFFDNIGITPIYDGYQIVWQIP